MLAQTALRPSTIGQILDRTVRLYRRNFWTFLGIVAVVQVPIALLSTFNVFNSFGGLFALIQDPLAPAEEVLGNPVITQLINLVVTTGSTFLSLFSGSAICLAVIHSLFGEPLTIGQAYRMMWQRWQSVTGMAVAHLGVNLTLGIALIIGLFFLIVPGVFVLGILLFFSVIVAPLTVPVLMLERNGVWDSLVRTWHLAKQRIWQLVGLIAVNYLFVNALIAGIQLVILTIFGVSVADSFSSGDVDETILPVAAAGLALTVLSGVFVLPLQQAIMTVIYLDLRVRSEGLDLALRLADADAVPLDVIATAPRQTNGERLIESGEFGRFLSLGCAPILLIVALYLGLLAIIFALIGVVGLGG